MEVVNEDEHCLWIQQNQNPSSINIPLALFYVNISSLLCNLYLLNPPARTVFIEH